MSLVGGCAGAASAWSCKDSAAAAAAAAVANLSSDGINGTQGCMEEEEETKAFLGIFRREKRGEQTANTWRCVTTLQVALGGMKENGPS